eukprot:TRINITY_DN20846_c1_g1_i5.p2 TRINITY_DN20846_c1_g1~~TRINITY_DN20846_c1_g1_i5.p2  ORF type:complete len:124 (-),score=7.26 TRINITY_DN20846_c1_g1_i5:102-473(-)
MLHLRRPPACALICQRAHCGKRCRRRGNPTREAAAAVWARNLRLLRHDGLSPGLACANPILFHIFAPSVIKSFLLGAQFLQPLAAWRPVTAQTSKELLYLPVALSESEAMSFFCQLFPISTYG